MGSVDLTTIEVPTILRDRLRCSKAHRNQAYYEVIEAARDFWEESGGWDLGDGRPKPLEWI